MSIHVNVDNFARAETDRMFHDLSAVAGGVNRWSHVRTPTPVEAQPVIRMNRDTLYSMAVVDLREPATVSLPDAGERYLSLMVVNQDHYVTLVAHGAGDVALRPEDHGTDYVCCVVRTLVDPADAEDVAEVNALQDQFGLQGVDLGKQRLGQKREGRRQSRLPRDGAALPALMVTIDP